MANSEQLWKTWRIVREGRHDVAFPEAERASGLFRPEPGRTRVKVCPLVSFAY